MSIHNFKMVNITDAMIFLDHIAKTYMMFLYVTVMMCPSGLFDGVREVPLSELLSELKEVDNWFDLGVYLKVPDHKLREIGQDYSDVEECKIEMILLWRQQSSPTWPAIVNALSDIGMHKLAVKIAEKYGE